MHISSIVLHGFKSFGKKSTIKLGRGITGVVGPNGCGKTNIVDALRWVLGEQRQSVIRAGRMEEIIFNGSKHHKPSSLCEVSVTIHNDKGKLPIEYTDIEITRRLYRDGESEYFINRQPCRLKDITDLFMDTGMGSDAYSVIELKMVEDILSEAGEDRRRMFEEAAGVNRYKKQRTSTFRKLEATRLDMERINDIAEEVGAKVKNLELQLKRFDRHRKLTGSLSAKELTLARLKVHTITKQKAPLMAVLQSGKSTRDSEADEIGKQEQEINSARDFQTELEQQYQAATTLLEAANEEHNEHRRQSAVRDEQIKASSAALARIATERSREEAGIPERQSTVEQLGKQMEALAPGTQEHRAGLAAKLEQEAAFTEAFKVAEAALEETREKHFRHQRQLLEAAARRQRTVELIKEQEAASKKLEAELQVAEEQVRQQSQALALLETGLGEKETAGAALEADAEQAATELNRLRKMLDVAKDEANAADTQRRLLETQLSMLQRLAVDHEGYPAGTRAVLSNLDEHPGVLGTVAALARLQGDHAAAVEAALGTMATALVVRTSVEARELLAAARQNRLGRLSVIPLDRIEDHATRTSAAAGLTRLVELITVDVSLRPLFGALLDGVFLASNNGEPDAGALDGSITIITPGGDRYGRVPLWTHGGGGDDSTSAPAASMVGRSAEIEKYSSELESSRLKLQEAVKNLQEAKEQIQVQEAESKEREALIAANLTGIADIKAAAAQIRYQQEQGAKGLTSKREELPLLGTDLKQLNESLASQSGAIEDLQKKEQALESAKESAQEKFSQAQQQMEKWREALQEHRLALINLENEREKLAERKLSLEDLLQSAAQRLTALAEEKIATEGELARLKEKVHQASIDVQDLLGKVTQAREAAGAAEANARKARDDISEQEAQLRSRQHRRESDLGDLQARELALGQLEREESLIRSRIKELYGKSVGKLHESDAGLDESSLQREVELIHRSLERIGPVNMAVSQEHSEELERLSILTDQRDDLNASEVTLRETIEKIDHQAREQFQTTYDAIRHHFKQTFAMFFEGGQGDLRLVGDPDPLESDIEIIAVPPGKKTHTLRSLSAGEKALTAIALLFAIYRVKPSPYCILDEVDAPLDDVNIGKFSKVISQFAEETQFIVVTHNKLSMEQADYLYGVTMAEEGLSTLVSVDLKQYAA
ncbi:MAG: chromosome segregation protein SMC [Candidatus Marinimicrobia bacterium]|nr:chromosome segregation protein SMC [Candidatus Neomarinimicrobiota bacterium]